MGKPSKNGGMKVAVGLCGLRSKAWRLRQVLVHSPSEHLWDGKHMDLELQLVHENANHKMGIAAIGFRAGGGWMNPVLQSRLLHGMSRGDLLFSALVNGCMARSTDRFLTSFVQWERGENGSQQGDESKNRNHRAQ